MPCQVVMFWVVLQGMIAHGGGGGGHETYA